jgi:glycerol-3-phosphate dehydrogenase (NAD(P)+)
MASFAVMGGGSWGTAFSLVLADGGNEVRLWARRDEVCEAINTKHENPDYFPGVQLPEAIVATHDAAKALGGAEYVVLAMPSQVLRENLSDWKDLVPADAVVLSLMKGVELGSLKRMSEVIAEVLERDPGTIAVVSGPNLSKEIVAREPAASVVACSDVEVAERVRDAIHGPSFRPYSSTDVVGCEIGGACKNVIALAVGMAIGLGFGDNTTASVITRGLAETARLATRLGADPLTLMGLAGLGDLVATCSSPLSRNRTFGVKLGTGMSREEITGSTRQVAEGVKSCSSILELAERSGVDVPIVGAVHAVVTGEISPQQLVELMLSRSTKPERD